MQASCKGFWRGINHNIDEMVKSCAPCQAHQVANTKATLIPHDVPKRAWHSLSTDLFHWNGTEYLIVVDFYSKFPIIRTQRNISSATIINHLKGIFDKHGILERLISDNSPQYSSQEFQVFSARYGFDHVTSSPLYPLSNGFLERTVQTVKKIFTKAKEGGGDPHLAMLCLRTTPNRSQPAIPVRTSQRNTIQIESTCRIVPVELGCKCISATTASYMFWILLG